MDKSETGQKLCDDEHAFCPGAASHSAREAKKSCGKQVVFQISPEIYHKAALDLEYLS